MNAIERKIEALKKEIPGNVVVEAVVKGRDIAKIDLALACGIKVIGENYIQQADRDIKEIGKNNAAWHFIGRVQSNKIKKMVELFDMVETLSSIRHAGKIDKQCLLQNKKMDALVEINIAGEPQKNGILLKDAESFIRSAASFKNIRIKGLMCMGPNIEPEGMRLYFAKMRAEFMRLQKLKIPGVEMRYLSMGMSGSFKVAVEEGANLIRIGSYIFG